MSSCKGRIFLGGSGIVVDEIEFSKKHVELDLWDENIEKKILEKIKNKAFEQAKSIVQKAQKEAITIKNNAYQEGYRDGLVKANEEVEKIKKETANRLTSILNGIEGEKKKILGKHIEDILKLIFISIEKITSIVFDEQKKIVLKGILEDCLKEIEGNTQVKVFVCEQDYPLINEVIEIIKPNFPDIKKWQLSVKENLSCGTVEIDTGASKIEDSFLKRKEKLLDIIKDLTLE